MISETNTDINTPLPEKPVKSGLISKLLSIFLIITIFAALAAIIWIINRSPQEEIIEFYLLNTEGKAYDYPTEVQAGSEFSVIAGIINNGPDEAAFHIETAINEESYSDIGPINIKHIEKHEVTISISPSDQGEHQKVEFILIQEGKEPPLHSLVLWIDVTGPDNAP